MSNTDGIDRILSLMKTQEQVESETKAATEVVGVAPPVITTTSAFLNAARGNSLNLMDRISSLRAKYEMHQSEADALLIEINELVTVRHTIVEHIHALEKVQNDG